MRSPFMVEDTAIRFVNLLEEGTELELMQLNDMAGSTRKFIEDEIPRRVPSPRAALFFHCGARALFARAMRTMPESQRRSSKHPRAWA